MLFFFISTFHWSSLYLILASKFIVDCSLAQLNRRVREKPIGRWKIGLVDRHCRRWGLDPSRIVVELDSLEPINGRRPPSDCVRSLSDLPFPASNQPSVLPLALPSGIWSHTHTHRLLPGFTGFSGPSPDLLGPTRISSHWVGFYWVFARFYWTTLGFTMFNWVWLSHNRVLLGFIGCIGFYHVSHGFTQS